MLLHIHLGNNSPSLHSVRGQEVTGKLEGYLSQLASALGIPATDLASVVKPYVPPATLLILAPQATCEAMKVLFEDSLQKDPPDGEGTMAEGLWKAVVFINL
ncbi:hypothetical protein BDR07DRAFT_1373920 [Suillus spraguei]|nr:hypothetical protein BDR07DRAFT_1373920 [Suillus spraguei]